MPEVEVTNVQVTHEVTSVSAQQVEASSSEPAEIVVSTAGSAGPKGEPGIVSSPNPPSDTNVLWADTDDTVSMTLIPGPTGATGPAGAVGPQGPAGSPTEFELRGVGFPEGVVTAGPGSYYTDSSITNGAVRWVKTSGTGNTGWQVLYGDTGWRDLTALFVASNSTVTGTHLLRRRDGLVTYKWSGGLGWTGGLSPVILNCKGLCPAPNFGVIRTLHGHGGGSKGSVEASMSWQQELRLGFYFNYNDIVAGEMSWIAAENGQGLTGQKWPNVLPGTAWAG